MFIYKLLFNIMAVGLALVGVAVAVLGYFGPSTIDQKLPKNVPQVPEAEAILEQLKKVQYSLGTAGLVIIGVAVLGILAFNFGITVLLVIFRVVVVVGAILFLALGALGFAGVYLLTNAYENHWRPKMEKFDPSPNKTGDFYDLHFLQISFKCCGVSGDDPYRKLTELPISCCLTEDQVPDDVFLHNTTIACTREKVKAAGRGPCDQVVQEEYITLGKIIAIVSLITGLYLVALVVLSCCKDRNEDED